MMKQIFVDDILHAFESEGNLHLVLGIVNGNVNEAGNDLRDAVVTLILPNNRATVISESLLKAINALLTPVEKTANESIMASEGLKVKEEFLGQGVRLPA
jgi:hypothetical protein